ncbi:MAG: LPS export ABC transporter periplasmic protein LptC [Gammaproteobacteria bacterium]|nr:LPS export ABC transporter periplasmic protein LptC [Gammaproteobacteria bacterium]
MNFKGIIIFVILLGALAFSRQFFSRTPAFEKPEQSRDRVVAGYYLTNAILEQRDQRGKPLYRLQAERIEQFPNSDLVRLSMVRINYPGSGQDLGWDLSADEGEIMAEGRKIVLRKNVRALERGENARRLIKTSVLIFDPVKSIASTDADVIFELDGYSLSATGMTADLKAHTVELQSTVNARFEP